MIANKRIPSEHKTYLVENGRVISSGLILTDKKKFLVCFSQKSFLFDIPKGKVEQGETVQQACLREVNEETGLDLSDAPLVDLGRKPYKETKDIHLFALVTHDLPPVEKMKSKEFFHTPYMSQRDMGDYRYVSFDQISHLSEIRRISPDMERFLKEIHADIDRLPYREFANIGDLAEILKVAVNNEMFPLWGGFLKEYRGVICF